MHSETQLDSSKPGISDAKRERRPATKRAAGCFLDSDIQCVLVCPLHVLFSICSSNQPACTQSVNRLSDDPATFGADFFDTFGMVCGAQDSQVRNIENEINELFEWVQNIIDEQP